MVTTERYPAGAQRSACRRAGPAALYQAP
ncbi:hypothetical protein SBRY_100112 [Actinacidiphila bryophytorum]|uniref:Uncharacterized protein n=1 Tax=Actinacidiphila bryophytorum TaxID=1436133 RepID=A0A9W4GYF5_9ACTN|nr:hypothetical protein SBRY_100112 [Actinacidiphila bryophytorum]